MPLWESLHDWKLFLFFILFLIMATLFMPYSLIMMVNLSFIEQSDANLLGSTYDYISVIKSFIAEDKNSETLACDKDGQEHSASEIKLL